MEFPFAKYAAPARLRNAGRRWPDAVATAAPRFASVDLRDGNQALPRPMGVERKLEMFALLCEIGLKEIEVGFPAASSTDLEFVRALATAALVPDDVTVGVLTQCRDDLVHATFAALDGLERAIVHLYVSTNPLQRDVVFSASEEDMIQLAVDAARLCATLAARCDTEITFEFSPESFSDTELDFALRICEAVADVLMAVSAGPMIVNLPATVEMTGPHVYADQIELFTSRFAYRDDVIFSVHPHNDRCCAVAAAELAHLAGAGRVEGTLFGNGERTGNVDLVTLALNLATHGIDPTLRLGDIDRLRDSVARLNELPVHPRHPYAGELVYTAFSGSHQDAIKKGLTRLGLDSSQRSDYERWQVPYLPVDPVHLGRSYEPVIRVNSQSGKGGVSWLLLNEYRLDLPRAMSAEFAAVVQADCDRSGDEVTSLQVRDLLDRTYRSSRRLVLVDFAATESAGKTELTVELTLDGRRLELSGTARGPLEAYMEVLSSLLGIRLDISDYVEHSLAARSDAAAVSYILVDCDTPGPGRWGMATADSITHASLLAATHAADRLLSDGAITPGERTER